MPDAFGRFEISHLGMSAFDTLRVFAVDHPEGRQLLIWEANGAVDVVELPPRALEQAGTDFLAAYAAAGLPL